MAVIRAVATAGGRKQQAIVRKGGFNLSRVFWRTKEAEDWSRKVEDAIASASPEKPFDRKAWLPLTNAEAEAASFDDSKPHDGWTVDRAMGHYADKVVPDKKGVAPEQARIRMWRASGLAGKKLAELHVDDVQAVVDARLAGGCAGDTVRREVNVLRALFRDALKLWKVKGLPDPFRGLSLPRPAPHRERRLEDGHGDGAGEEQRLRAALSQWKVRPDVLVDLFDFAIETGLRLSEVHAVTVGSIRRKGGVLRVELLTSKNDDPRRVVLTARAGEIASRRMDGMQPGAKLFPVSDSARRRAWAAARGAAGITDLRWHDLRHEGISRMAGKNLHLGELMAQSGHRDAESLKRYMNARAQDIARKLG